MGFDADVRGRVKLAARTTGRERIHDALAGLGAGEGIAVVAPSGSGKSTELAAYVRHRREMGDRIVWGAAWVGPSPPPLWHWRQLDAAREGGRRTVAEVVDEVLLTLERGPSVIALDDADRADPLSAMVLREVVRHLPGYDVRLVATGRSPALEELGLPAVGRHEALVATAANREVRASISRRGDVWTVAFGGTLSAVRDRKGMSYLARLVDQPGQEIHVLELAGDGVRSAGTPTADATAISAYRREWRDLAADLEEAERLNDELRAAAIRVRLDQLESSVASALAIGGRSRLLGDACERARLNVTRALRSTIATLGTGDRALGAHLQSATRTGTFCSYRPDPTTAVDWSVAI